MSESQPPGAAPAAPPLSRTFAAMSFLFGVALPLITLGVELTTRLNSEVFFDPLPSLFHVLLVALVPAANLAVWLTLRSQHTRHLQTLALANGCAIGISLFYTLLFLPLLPIGAVAIIYFGMGLLPLAPLLSLIVAISLRVRLSRFAERSQTLLRLWPGIALGIVALLALDIPATFTRFGMQMATSATAATRSQGVRWLRIVGSEDLMLRLCYVRSGATADMLSFLFNITHPISTEEARKIYYRVTGVPFNAVPAPVPTHRGRRQFFGAFDGDQGTETVGGRVRGLSLAASRLDGSLDGDAALGYLEWTLVFRNDSDIPGEARSQIALPPGAVVSRLTLWIEGEEREAAFAGRREVRQAYESVVSRNRDPVLVTTAGQDRILMQLFPVPARGEMKVRMGMTLPLTLRGSQEGELKLPFFHERNFDIGQQLRHAAWIESKSPLRSGLATAARADGAFLFRSDVEDARLGTASSVIVVERDTASDAWAVDGKESGYFVRQSIRDHAAVAPSKVIVVVDGSASMSEAAPRVAKAFATMPQGIELELLIAHDEVMEGPTRLTGAAIAEQLQEFDYGGGHDNTEALARGIDRALAQPNSTVLWIHGPQPVLLSTEEALLQQLERRSKFPPLYELQVRPGVNLLGEKLEGRLTTLSLRDEDLQPLLLGWRPGARRIVVQRERLKTADGVVMQPDTITSDHLIRLWANDEVARMLSATSRRQDAVALAQQYQLVTPVSGAVVLETQQQYAAAGLEPVPPGTVPTIPEPETWALIVIVLLVLAYSYRRRRRLGTDLRHAI
jgi:hypothetical protein